MVTTLGAIQVIDVEKTFESDGYEPVKALDRVNTTIEAGSFVSIVGASGCGKTTLLRLIAGLETPTGGEVLVDGKRVEGPHHERGLVFQQPKLFPWLNLYDNVAFGLRARGVYADERDTVDELIDLVGLKGFEKAFPHHLSGGMQQRAALARALVNHPKVLLLDEPLGALDSITREAMQDELLNIWRARGTTMVMVTHDVEEAVYLSDRILAMSPRRSRVEKVVDVPLPHPRRRDSEGFLSIKRDILQVLNLRGQTAGQSNREEI